MATYAQRKSARTISRYATRRRTRDKPRYVSPPITVVTSITGKPGEAPTATTVQRQIGEPTPSITPPKVEAPKPTEPVARKVTTQFTPEGRIAPARITPEALGRRVVTTRPAWKKAALITGAIGLGVGLGYVEEARGFATEIPKRQMAIADPTGLMYGGQVGAARAGYEFVTKPKRRAEVRGAFMEFGEQLRISPGPTVARLGGKFLFWETLTRTAGRGAQVQTAKQQVIKDVKATIKTPTGRAQAFKQLRQAKALRTGTKPGPIQLEKVQRLKGKAPNIVEGYLKKTPSNIVGGSAAEQAYLGKQGRLKGGVSDLDVYTTGVIAPQDQARALAGELKAGGVKRVSVITTKGSGKVTIGGKKAVEFHKAKEFLYPGAFATGRIAPEITLAVKTPQRIKIPKVEHLAQREIIRGFETPFQRARGIARFKQLKAVVEMRPLPSDRIMKPMRFEPMRGLTRRPVSKFKPLKVSTPRALERARLKPLKKVKPTKLMKEVRGPTPKKITRKVLEYPKYPEYKVGKKLYPKYKPVSLKKLVPPYRTPTRKEVPYAPLTGRKLPDVYKPFGRITRAAPYKPSKYLQAPYSPTALLRPSPYMVAPYRPGKYLPSMGVPTRGVGLALPKYRGIERVREVEHVVGPRPFKYTPSLIAAEFGIRGKKPERITGLGLRPLLKGMPKLRRIRA